MLALLLPLLPVLLAVPLCGKKSRGSEEGSKTTSHSAPSKSKSQPIATGPEKATTTKTADTETDKKDADKSKQKNTETGSKEKPAEKSVDKTQDKSRSATRKSNKRTSLDKTQTQSGRSKKQKATDKADKAMPSTGNEGDGGYENCPDMNADELAKIAADAK